VGLNTAIVHIDDIVHIDAWFNFTLMTVCTLMHIVHIDAWTWDLS
jgi:hypothetical protein